MTYFCPALHPPLGGSGRKTTTLVREHGYFIPTKFHKNPSSGSGEEVENMKDDGRRTDGAIWTRAPRGTDRSPDYNEHFCYKLDSRVKNWLRNRTKKQQHFITLACRSLLWIQFAAVAFRSDEEVSGRRGPRDLFWPRPGFAPGLIWPKHLNACSGPWAFHPYQVL